MNSTFQWFAFVAAIVAASDLLFARPAIESFERRLSERLLAFHNSLRLKSAFRSAVKILWSLWFLASLVIIIFVGAPEADGFVETVIAIAKGALFYLVAFPAAVVSILGWPWLLAIATKAYLRFVLWCPKGVLAGIFAPVVFYAIARQFLSLPGVGE